MGTPARRDDLLEQLRALPVEDRDYVEAALTDSADELAEITERAADALRGARPSHSREESVARARGAVEAIRSRKP
jgi:hypothetical protein